MILRSLLKIVTIRGMPVRLHYTWLLVALIGIPLLTTIIIPTFLPDSSGLARIALALLILVLVRTAPS
jgi:hypothetical protein